MTALNDRRGSRDIERIGSAHDDVELELLKAVAWQRLAAGQDELDLANSLGFAQAAGGDEVFRDVVLARAAGDIERDSRVAFVIDAVSPASDQGFRKIAGLGAVLCTTAEAVSWRA
jgi:hypothetical protein